VNADLAASGAKSYLRWWEAVPPELQGEMVAELNRFMLDPTMATAEDVMATMQALNAEYWASK
jgi:multiple sugar transport system substrate-binding protein